jgi:hypothetical protein
MTQFQLGSISTGTLRPEDLLKAFLPYLNKENEHAQEAQAVLERIATDTWPPGIDNLEQYLTEFNTSELLDIIMDELQELCPPFVCFGTLEGDGADFGFWVDWDRLNEAMQNIGMASESDEEILKEDNVIVQVSDHGNVTVMDMERNVIWSVV